MNAMQVESASRLAWPALEEEELPFGVLRYTRGAGRRANSLNIFPDAKFEINELIETTEKFFNARKTATTVRLLEYGSAAHRLDQRLQRRGYVKQSSTLSMTLNLSDLKELEPIHAAHLHLIQSREHWLAAWVELTGRNLDELGTHEAMLKKIESEHIFLLNKDALGWPLSCAMGVFSEGAVGLFGVATAGHCRKQGQAFALVNGLLAWGKAKGACHAYLQAEESNKSAVKLYKKAGFQALYSYWYRVKTA